MNYISQNYDIVKPKIIKHFMKKVLMMLSRTLNKESHTTIKKKKNLKTRGYYLKMGKLLTYTRRLILKQFMRFITWTLRKNKQK